MSTIAIDFPAQQRTTRAAEKSTDDSRITSEYVERERSWANEDEKTPQRQRIADFFLEFHKPGQPLRLLSLPGLHWQFEREILGRHPQCSFVGLEWTWGVIELGRPFMPGDQKHARIWACGASPFHGWRSSVARWVFCKAGRFFSQCRSEIPGSFTGSRQWRGSKKDRHEFARKFKSNSCIWLDFTSQLCAETRSAIDSVQRFADLRLGIVPVCVTVMAARDNHESDAARVDEISYLLGLARHRNFGLCDSWTYTHNGIPMLNVLGFLASKGERPDADSD